MVTMSSEMKPKPDENHEPEPVAGGEKPPAAECRQQTPEPDEPSTPEDRKEAFRNRALSVQTPGYSLCEPEPCEYLHDFLSVNVSGYSPPSPSYEPNK